MVIQHNLMALNAYRQLNNNNLNLAKTLEKLASGYRINRAGDDAAGLAISEKMRAQIKGLETAQKNALDGISLIQTAEGALTELHSILNRMVELAGQASNGIYDDAVDRKALDDEFQQLKAEIDRISKATNFNGKNLLDGSLGTGGAGGVAGSGGLSKISSELAGVLKFGQSAPVAAIAAQYKVDSANVKSFAAGFGLDATPGTTALQYASAVGIDLKKYNVFFADTSLRIDNVDTAKAIKELESGMASVSIGGTEVGGTIYRANYDLYIVSKFPGVDPGKEELFLKGVSGNKDGAIYESRPGMDTYRQTTLIIDPDAVMDTNLIGKTFTINGNTYQFTGQNDLDEIDKRIETANGARLANGNFSVNLACGLWQVNSGTFNTLTGIWSGGDSVTLKNGNTIDIYQTHRDYNSLDPAAHHISTNPGVSASAALKPGQAAAEFVARQIMLAVNEVSTTPLYTPANTLDHHGPAYIGKGWGTANDDYSRLNIVTFDIGQPYWRGGGAVSGSGGGLKLQIGDTGDSYNVITVAIEDMSSKGLGLHNLNIGSYESAVAAVGTIAKQGDPGTIKGAINLVSSQRGSLGALQNKLEHSVNNLAITVENVTAAESRIRDTDMAKEMMAYTKNNILVQAAQAMLAQANTVPQGVLQLLR